MQRRHINLFKVDYLKVRRDNNCPNCIKMGMIISDSNIVWLALLQENNDRRINIVTADIDTRMLKDMFL